MRYQFFISLKCVRAVLFSIEQELVIPLALWVERKIGIKMLVFG